MGAHAAIMPPSLEVEDFLAFADARPAGEKWELIAGSLVLSPSPNRRHQIIVGNVFSLIADSRRKSAAAWEVLLGIGVKISPKNAPVPDILIRPFDDLQGAMCDDIIAAFEILSPSTADHDLRWKRKVYASLPTLQHYVIIAQDDLDVIVYDRSTDFAERRIEKLDAALDLPALDLPALGLLLPLRDIYENTGANAL